MSFDEKLLEFLIESCTSNDSLSTTIKFTLHVNDRQYPVKSTVIVNSPIPVNEPTSRGGVYFSEKFAYKMRCIVEDLSVVPLLTKKMLGPNTEFGELRITADTERDGLPVHLEIFTNLTNSVQTPDSIELGMIIVRLESVSRS